MVALLRSTLKVQAIEQEGSAVEKVARDSLNFVGEKKIEHLVVVEVEMVDLVVF